MAGSSRSLLFREEPGILRFGGARVALVDIEAGFWSLRRQIEALAGRRLADAVLQQAGANGGASFARSFAGEKPADGAQALRDCLAALQGAGLGRFALEDLEWPLGRARIRAADTFESWMARHHSHTTGAPVCAYEAGILAGLADALSDRHDLVCVERACQAQGAEACLFEILPASEAAGAATVAFDPDPYLSHQVGLLEILLDRMPMGIAILDRDLRLRRCNPTWAGFIGHYTRTPASQVVPGAHLFDLAPGIEDSALPLLEQALAGETVRYEAWRMESGGIVSYWDVVWQPLLENGEVAGLVEVSTDATERVLAHQALEQRVVERTQALTTMLQVSHNLAYTLELEPLLGQILEQLKAVVDYSGATILTLQGTDLAVRAYRGPIPQEEVLQTRFPLDGALVNREVVLSRRPAIIDDVRGDAPLAQGFRRTAGKELETTYGYIRSWMGVPLMVKQQVIGMLTLDHSQPDYYTTEQAELALAFANQAAVAIENARLYAEAQRRIDESQTLFAVQQAITSRLDPDTVLQLIADEARRLTSARSTVVFMREGDELCVSTLSGDEDPGLLGFRVAIDESLSGLCIRSGQPLRIEDIHSDPHINPELKRRAGIRSLMSVPLMSGSRVIGTISVADKQAGAFDEDEERLLMTLASAAAVGLENARLYSEEQERHHEDEQRRQVAEGLREVLAILNSNRPLAEVLDCIMMQAGRLLGTDKVAIYRLHEDGQALSIQVSRGLPAEYVADMVVPVGDGAVGRAVLSRQPVSIPDVRAAFPADCPFLRDAQRARALQHADYLSLLAVPLVVKDEVYGGIVLYYPEPHEYTAEELELAASIGHQAALAIENARLRSQAEQAAVSAERSRLARDLHDAVTQTLFSASLIAEVLPRIWDKDEAQGRRRLAELRQLTRGALAEMRTLLVELRPTALVEAALGDLLRQLAEAITGRARVPVSLTVEGQGTLPPDVQIALYRITQEALNNVVKHSGASKAALSLRWVPPGEGQGVVLDIVDDGCGFDPRGVLPDHLGVGIMRERAEAVGARLEIASQIGQGTSITITWPKAG